MQFDAKPSVVPCLPAVLTCIVLACAAARLPAQEPPQQTDRLNQQIARLIEQLGDKDYFVRQRAQEKLSQFSVEAFDALNEATTHEDLEVAARARYLLRLMQVEWVDEKDPPEVKKYLKDYRSQDDAHKHERIRLLARLPSGAGVAALCRLVRYEKSPVLSKRAAMAMLQHHPPKGATAEKLRKGLGRSSRRGAAWLLAWLKFAENPRAALTDWTKLVDDEYALLASSASHTDPEIVTGMIRFQIGWLKELGRNDKVLLAMRRLLDLEQGDPETLEELIGWLVEQKAWAVIDELSERFAPRFAANPLLLYTLAQAQLAAGEKQRAEATVQRALKLNPGKDSRQLISHYTTARSLIVRGMSEWARREYRHVVETGPADNPVVVASLTDLLNILVRQKAWKSVEELVARFASQAAGNAVLLYTQAQLQAVGGNPKLAEETALKAFKLDPGKGAEPLGKHRVVARVLADRGLFSWAEREYRHVVETGEPSGIVVISARYYLAEMLHDQDKDLEAAEALEGMISSIRKRPAAVPAIGLSAGETVARMHYFFASHFKAKRDRAKQREHLDKAFETGEADVDVLIAGYRFSAKDPQYRKKVVGLIEKSAAEIEQAIDNNPDHPTAYNQYAWLIGNTEGDSVKALRYSKKSLELRPDSGGYHDTLAHVHFHRGEYEEAVKAQAKAVELEPHSGLVARQLEVFRKRLAEEKRKKRD